MNVQTKPLHIYEKISFEALTPDEQQDSCAICFEHFSTEQPILVHRINKDTKYFHPIDELCVSKWLDCQSCCPLCKEPIALAHSFKKFEKENIGSIFFDAMLEIDKLVFYTATAALVGATVGQSLSIGSNFTAISIKIVLAGCMSKCWCISLKNLPFETTLAAITATASTLIYSHPMTFAPILFSASGTQGCCLLAARNLRQVIFSNFLPYMASAGVVSGIFAYHLTSLLY